MVCLHVITWDIIVSCARIGDGVILAVMVLCLIHHQSHLTHRDEVWSSLDFTHRVRRMHELYTINW